MGLPNTVISALRALSSVPDLPTDALHKFSQSLEEIDLVPDASFGADPVWRIQKGAQPPKVFADLVGQLCSTSGLVGDGKYFAFELADVIMIITHSTLREIVGEVALERITPAEVNVAVQLLQGYTLRKSAVVDNIGYETKRSHFKVLASKLGLRGQSEVVRILTTYMLQRLAHLAQPQSNSDFDQYARTYFPPSVRRLNITTTSGLVVPVLDYGPVTGDPLVVLHPMIFPPIGIEEIAQADRLGVRILWPIRCGLLDRSAPIQRPECHIESSVTGLLTVIEQLIGKSAPVLALVSSGAVAVRAAHRRPDLIKSICFAATCYSAGRKSKAFRYFGSDLAELALRNEALMTRTVAALNKYVDSETRFRGMMEAVFKGSAPDIAHISSEFGSSDAGARLRTVVSQSSESMKHDFFNQTHFRWTELSDLTTPIHFLQGSEDTIHPPGELEILVRRFPNAKLSIAAGMGHLTHGDNLRRVIDFAYHRKAI